MSPAPIRDAGAEEIEAVRAFGRFYTAFLGVLNEGLLDSPFSTTESRIIYELARGGVSDSGALGTRLGLDSGYLSRLLSRLEAARIIARSPSPEDGRVKLLSLTADGVEAFEVLDRASTAQVDRVFAGLSRSERHQLVDAMTTVRSLLGDDVPEPPSFRLRAHEPGDLGWVVQRHGVLYAAEYQWGQAFEGLVAEIVGTIALNFDPARERCWIAEREGERVGSVFLVSKSEHVAQLRLLLVEPAARGLGIGRRLVSECSRFARGAGYRSVVLWTMSVLESARRLYEAEGYRLTNEEPHTDFGHDLTSQMWELQL